MRLSTAGESTELPSESLPPSPARPAIPFAPRRRRALLPIRGAQRVPAAETPFQHPSAAHFVPAGQTTAPPVRPPVSGFAGTAKAAKHVIAPPRGKKIRCPRPRKNIEADAVP